MGGLLYVSQLLLVKPSSLLHSSFFHTSDLNRASSPTVTYFLATVVTDPTLSSLAASALVAELVEFAVVYRLDYLASLVSNPDPACPPSVGGEVALGCDVLGDRQEELECLAAAAPHLATMLLAPEGDPDALYIPTPRSYREAILGEYSSQRQTAMYAEMASWKSTCTYVDEVPPLVANIVSAMWTFRVKRPPGSPPAFKARYGVEFFQTFFPTPKMTTLRVLLHVAARHDYELHSLDFSTAFLQVHGLHQAPRQWHDTLRTKLAVLGFAPSTADLSLFLRTDTTLPPFYVFVYIDDLVFATADTETLALLKAELQDKHTCIDLGELRSYLGLQITRDRAQRTITLTQSHMVHHVLQRFGFQFSSPQLSPLPTGHLLSAPPSDLSVEPEPLGEVSTMAGPEERGGRGAGSSGEAKAQGQPRDSAMGPVQPSLGPPRDEPRVLGLDKFNGDNFAEWSFRMENVFDHYDLLEVMEGTEKRPENDPEKSPWVQKSAQGYPLLGQALGSSQIRHIKPFQREPEKGPKAWAALKGVHAPATAAVAVVLERQMAALRIEEDEAVEEGVQKFFDLLTRLEGADLNYSELQKKTKLLALLPESWSSLIINLNRDLPCLSLEDVKRAILHEDFRRLKLASADGTGAASIGRGYGRGRGRGRGGGRFGSNNSNGGRGSGGYGSDNKSYGRGRGQFDGECHYCHKSGHMWRNCYKLPHGWTPDQGREGRGAGGGRGRGCGGRGGREVMLQV
ncbi:unnamed protein product [Closterium sp. NIES-54]